MDFSWPHGESINDKVSNDQYIGRLFKLKFPMVDEITDRITYLNGNCLLYKNGIQRAVATLNLDPRDIDKTWLQFEGNYYVDTAVPFGYLDVSCIIIDISSQIT